MVRPSLEGVAPALLVGGGKGHLKVLVLASSRQKSPKERLRAEPQRENCSARLKSICPLYWSAKSRHHLKHIVTRKPNPALSDRLCRVPRRRRDFVGPSFIAALERDSHLSLIERIEMASIVDVSLEAFYGPRRPGEALVERSPLGARTVAATEQNTPEAKKERPDDRQNRPENTRKRHTLISTSTPLGSSSCMSESTVSLLDERMSIRRLWWRRSNCSRLFLSTCGPRNTV